MANSCINEKFELSYDSIKMMKIPININEYSIQKVVTESQFCLVVSASNTKNSQKVAIKFIPIKYFQRDGKEDLIMRQLNHPNIIKLIDSFLYPIKNPRFFAIVMPLAILDLDTYIYNNGPLSEAMVWKIMKDSLKAIKYMHKNNIWHRDIKLENILVVEEGYNGLSIVISDFGISDIIETEIYHGRCVGTLQFAAPELLELNLGRLEFKKITDCMFFNNFN